MTARLNVERCIDCGEPIRKREQEFCRSCIDAKNWNPSLFNYPPSSNREAK